MKKLALALVVLFGFVSLAWGGPQPNKVEIVNVPLDVNVVNQSSQYEYKVFRLESGSVAEGVQNFQTELNANASLGWELVSFSYQQTTAATHIYVGVMRRPIQ